MSETRTAGSAKSVCNGPYDHGNRNQRVRSFSGAESWLAMSTDDPAQMEGCADCLELVVEDVEDTGAHMGRCPVMLASPGHGQSGDPAR